MTDNKGLWKEKKKNLTFILIFKSRLNTTEDPLFKTVSDILGKIAISISPIS